ncbi:patatin-like phospholipase family protein [Flavihumibacter profundi]|jgi:NTE family protein|uniref:patatin-like phospholipase family protein n=1 Tax=Flavihumibacter profundi TaxID=2716883 RepID=UPI001CC76115|nr:patatin-like phospholipase family protein [Flavihumibacter profundi]MBZ5856135.1 patatin-like phospholipase family protein [Flavihumibacter profundi]
MRYRNIFLRSLFSLIFFHSLLAYTQQNHRPKIGLTLSGGGAKGLAHIGILKAIDSAGLQIDYVTGTSMGAIVGSLYAVGYSGDSILQIANKLDWSQLLSNKSSLNAFIMEEKSEYGRYALELPMQTRGRFSVPSGVLEAEELWLKFDELFHPVYQVRDFNQLKRPFKCIATDLATGEAVVLDSGDLVSAVRSSMAIPSVFTAVNLGNKKLVDGGLVRNFPVSDVRQMGADIVIGSNVATGLLSAQKITSPIQILMQIAFFKEAESVKQEIGLVDYYITHPLAKYNTASFNSSDSITAIGLEMGNQFYPVFKHLADSLNAIYGIPEKVTFPATAPRITIRHVITDSLRYISKVFLVKMLGIKEGQAYTVKELEDGIRQAYGTRYFNRLYYQLEPVESGVADMHLIAEENAPVTAKLAINYNSFSNIMLIANMTIRDIIGKPSISSATIGISENPRLRLEHTMIFGTKKIPMASITEMYGERQEFSSYKDFRVIGSNRQSLFYVDTRLQLAFKRRSSYAVGMHWETGSIKPLSQTILDLRGTNNFSQAYFRYEYNSHDRLFLPRRGGYVLFEPSVIINRPEDITLKSNGAEIGNMDSLGIKKSTFTRFRFQAQKVVPVSRKNFITLQAEADANFNTNSFVFQDFVVGGMQPVIRNQVTFTGIPDASVRTNSLVKGSFNWRYQFSGSVYAAATLNLMYHSFLQQQQFYYTPEKLLTGYGLTLGIDSPIGPLEFSFMYSDQSGILKNYVNLGYRFSRAMF